MAEPGWHPVGVSQARLDSALVRPPTPPTKPQCLHTPGACFLVHERDAVCFHSDHPSMFLSDSSYSPGQGKEVRSTDSQHPPRNSRCCPLYWTKQVTCDPKSHCRGRQSYHVPGRGSTSVDGLRDSTAAPKPLCFQQTGVPQGRHSMMQHDISSMSTAALTETKVEDFVSQWMNE